MGALIGALAQELVKDLNTAINEQAQYVVQHPDQFKELEENMKFMQSFVADASRKKDNRETVKAAIATLQELIYQADDLVVDCQIREDYQKNNGRSSILSPSEMYFRLQTGKKLSQINSEIRRIRESLNSYYGTITADHVGGENSLGGRHWSSRVFAPSETPGLEKDTKAIMEWIFNENEELLLIGIVGLGGVGKTTLAKKIYNDPESTSLYRKKIWIWVSQLTNVVHIMRSMLKQLGEKDSAGYSSEGDMQTRIRQLLSDKTYLIVLDDVWSIENGWWTSLCSGLPRLKMNKNCIIITSRSKKVVKEMGVVEERVHQPRLLNEEESWELFCKVAKISKEEPQTLQDTGKKIVEKCGGFPLAIKTIGGMLSTNHKKSLTEWTRINDNFHSMLTEEGNHSEGNMSVIASLQLSYDELPACLKPCLLCFSIYPEDHEIEVDQLIHWWVGEGFVRGKNEETTTELALNCLSELISRSLVEVAQTRNFDGSAYTCKVDRIVRDLTIQLGGYGDFCSFDWSGNHIANSSSRRIRVGSDTKFQNMRRNSKLRVLFLTAGDLNGFSRDSELANVHSLRVLDLSKLKLDSINVKDLWEWITSLKRLAYLNLRGVARLCEVPNSIGKLWGLQVLIFEECRSLKQLPPSIVKLPRLIFLSVGYCPLLKFLPQGFSRLSNLQELYGFKIAGPSNLEGSHLGELESLTELRVLQIDITEESRIQDQDLKVLAKLEKLKLLSINAGDQRDILMQLDKLSPPANVEELYLNHYVGETMPEWISPKKLKKLQYFCMEYSRVKKMSEDFLTHGKCETGDAQCKWDVKGVCLMSCQWLDLSWDELKHAMPEIRYLEINHCNSLRHFPCDVTAMGFWRREHGDDGFNYAKWT